MPSVNYNDRFFAPAATSENGEADGSTVFHYRQEGSIVWATYSGGAIRFGVLLAQVMEDGSLHMHYQHVNNDGEFRHGKCHSVPEVLADGRLRMHEQWEWQGDDTSAGQSVLEEVSSEIRLGSKRCSPI